jgi:hypothetical protein
VSASRLVVLASNPRDRGIALRQLEEVQRLRHALDASPLTRRVRIEEHLAAQPADLEKAFANAPDALYFTGFHASRAGGIVLEDAAGFSAPIDTARLVELSAGAAMKLRLVFLCTCYSDRTVKAMAAHVECGIGFSGQVADNFANEFSDRLFAELFARSPCRDAFESAQTATLARPDVARDQGIVGITDAPKIFFGKGVDAKTHLAFTARPLKVFISYGGPDQEIAQRVNAALEARGVQTFLFAHDAKPGQPLHRMMQKGVNEHDWTLLLCSKQSLDRPGVLNEIEQSMRKSSRAGGRNILVPLAIDDYVFEKWKPTQPDLAQYIRDLVIADLRTAVRSVKSLGKKMDELVAHMESPD